MKYKITLYLTILLLSSCTILEKAGIEKRRYRPGYYLSSASSQSPIHRQLLESIANEKINKELKTKNPLAEPIHNNDMVAMSSQEKQVQLSPNRAKAGIVPKIKSVIEKIQYDRPSHKLFHERSALCATEKSTHSKYWGDSCIDVLVEITIVILAVIILYLFPGITPQAAELIAMAILIVAAIVVVIFVANN